MTDIKLEVGQVWKSSEYEASIKDVYESCNSKVIAYRRTVLNTSILDSMYHPEETFRKYYNTLITNADGTPHTPPKKYKELTPVEAMRLLADCNQDDAIECELSDSGDWLASQLMGSSHGRFPFMDTDNNVWKYCRIEVTND